MLSFWLPLGAKSSVSYNQMGNNDGVNLSAPHTFWSKSNIVDDTFPPNGILHEPHEHPVVTVIYLTLVNDSFLYACIECLSFVIKCSDYG